MRRRKPVLCALAILSLALLPVGAEAANGHANARAVCPSPPAGFAHCHALVVTDSRGNPNASTSPTGLSPATIKSAYSYSTSLSAGSGTTIAIVDAYDDPNAESDLNTFSSQYGLPACTTANGCFRKVNQTGGASYPRSNSGWALEISLDVQWAHAIAPGAKILLVEASSNSFANLLAAEDYAKAHAQYVSNSWGASEFSGENTYDSHFSQSGVSFFVSAGDAGLPAEYPSSSPNVVSVGGTTLHFSGSTFTGETGWSSGGGGCSAYENANSAQSSFSQYAQVSCGGRRATPDLSLDADPNSGVSVYDTTSYYGQKGWFTVGGTSASSPMVAARSAVAGAFVNASYVYGNSISYRDITSGNNGAPCLVGYDLCTGRGSWTGGASSSPPAQATLSFATGAETLTAGQPSGPMQIGLSAQSSSVTVSLSSSSPSGTFSASSSGPWSSSLQLTIAAGQSTSPGFFYEDTQAGTPQLTGSASGYTSATQTETVEAGTLDKIVVSPGSASVPVGGSQPFSVAGSDAYGNAVDVSGAAWTTTAPGTVSPGSGSSTMFTADSTQTGTGVVSATVGSLSDSATVTVTGLTPPSNLTASAQGKHISLSWTGSGSGVTYSLYRATASGQETLYAANLTSTSANDMAVSSGVAYYYYVKAVAPSGTESAPSNEASATAK